LGATAKNGWRVTLDLLRIIDLIGK